MEGVMMRGATSMAMAVRAPDGEIVLETKRLRAKKPWYAKVPVVRGVVSFVQSMASGVTTLLRSAEVSSDEEETPGKFAMAIAVVLGVVLAVGLFILLPSFLTSLIERFTNFNNVLLSSLIEGAIRILLFIGYLLLVSRMKDIRRTFMYHGAEHRTINCYEKGLEMTVENVQKCSTRHNRCGTTFLFFVIVLSILIFSLANWIFSLIGIPVFANAFVKMAIRLALLPLVAGLSYELLRFLAVLPDNAFVNVLRAPGLALQRLTTYPPEDEMAQVALKSFLAVLEMDSHPEIKEVKFFEKEYSQAKKEALDLLREIGGDECEFDFMMCEILGLKRGQLFKVNKLSAADNKRLKGYLKQRKEGKPLDYVLGYSEFCGERITVNESVLVPRPETELLAEKAVQYIGERDLKVLDLCTGSGCIAKVLSRTNAQITAVDISEAALSVAEKNLEGSGVRVLQSDMFSALDGEKFDLIVSNPPYIKTADMEGLSPEVKSEPFAALCGGDDGLKFYRVIASGMEGALSAGGALMLEIGFDEGEQVQTLFSDSFESVEVCKDYSQNDRMIICKGKK